jgi:DNA-binding GntR family transcriptional regulator
VSKQLNAPRRLETYELLRHQILIGRFAPSERIVESTLCEELGVSRTPMREALFRLEQDGLVRQDPARGFSVMPLTAREVREIYPIIWTLEALAVQLGANNLDIDILKRLNRSLQKAVDHEKQHEIDDEWHGILVSGCKNKRLLKQLDVLKLGAHRYELAYMRHCDKLGTSIDEHEAVLSAIQNGDIKKAGRLIEEHWQRGMDNLLDWLDWEDSE